MRILISLLSSAGTWRSPEEYKDWGITEEIDVWSLGNNMYTILTGFEPFEEIEKAHDTTVKKLVGRGQSARIDPRFKDHSPEEGVLVKAIQWCFEADAKKRATIFQVVELLQKALHDHVESKGLTRGQVLQQLPIK